MLKSGTLVRMFGEALAPDGSLVRDRFSAWFANSKVVSPSGRPLLVFHSTTSDFSAFNTEGSDLGSHFGGIDQAHARVTPLGNAQPNVIPAWLSLQNPLRLKDVGSFHADGVALQLERKGLLPKGEGKRMHRLADANWRLRKEFDPVIKKILESAGFDGVVYSNAMEGKGDSFIAFKPGQVKSSIGNSGMFDSSDPDFCDRRWAVEKHPQLRVLRAREFLNVASSEDAKKSRAILR